MRTLQGAHSAMYAFLKEVNREQVSFNIKDKVAIKKCISSIFKLVTKRKNKIINSKDS